MAKQKKGNYYYSDTATRYLHRKRQPGWIAEQKIVEELIAALPAGAKVLDVPFGTGRFVDLYLRKGLQVFGLEISHEMIELARRELGRSFLLCDVRESDATERLPFPDNCFETIICFRFLKFFPYQVATEILKEFHRVTKSSLVVWMKPRRDSEPSAGPLEELEAIEENLYDRDNVAMFSKAGFTVEKKLMLDSYIPLPDKKQKVTRLLGHIRRGTIFSSLRKKAAGTKEKDSGKPQKDIVVYCLKKNI